jgi:CRISPR/Cas system-associated protein Csm6
MEKYYSGIAPGAIEDEYLLDEAVSLAMATPSEIAARDEDDQAWAGTIKAEIARRGLSERLDDLIAAIREAE